MKLFPFLQTLSVSVFVGLLLGATPGFAKKIDVNLQATILNPGFSKAVEDATKVVSGLGGNYVITLGSTGTQKLTRGPGYLYYIPVYASPIVVSTVKPKLMGNILVNLEVIPNIFLPLVKEVQFTVSE